MHRLVNGQPLTIGRTGDPRYLGRLGRLVRYVHPHSSAQPGHRFFLRLRLSRSLAGGFRLYSRRNGRQQHRGLDFGTILKFIEEVFNLSNINSGDLGSFADQWSKAISAISSSSATANDFQSIQALSSQTSSSIQASMDPPERRKRNHSATHEVRNWKLNLR